MLVQSDRNFGAVKCTVFKGFCNDRAFKKMYVCDWGDILGFQRPALAHVNACRKMRLEINFMYLDNKKTYFTFKTCCI